LAGKKHQSISKVHFEDLGENGIHRQTRNSQSKEVQIFGRAIPSSGEKEEQDSTLQNQPIPVSALGNTSQEAL
jgi:hypothetical protein